MAAQGTHPDGQAQHGAPFYFTPNQAERANNNFLKCWENVGPKGFLHSKIGKSITGRRRKKRKALADGTLQTVSTDNSDIFFAWVTCALEIADIMAPAGEGAENRYMYLVGLDTGERNKLLDAQQAVLHEQLSRQRVNAARIDAALMGTHHLSGSGRKKRRRRKRKTRKRHRRRKRRRRKTRRRRRRKRRTRRKR